MSLRRRGIKGPGLHSEQLLARDQAQVLPVPQTLLLCKRQEKSSYKRPPKRSRRAHPPLSSPKGNESHHHSPGHGALHLRLWHHHSGAQTEGKKQMKIKEEFIAGFIKMCDNASKMTVCTTFLFCEQRTVIC